MWKAAHLWDLDGCCLGISQTIRSLGICDASEGLNLTKEENTTMWDCGPALPKLHISGEKPGISILI